MEYIGLERVRDVMREVVAEKSLGERAMTREVNIVRWMGRLMWQQDEQASCMVLSLFGLVKD